MQSVARVLDQTEASRSCGPGDSSLEGCTCYCIASVMSDSVRPHRWQDTRLLCPWDSPGKNTGVGSHFLLQCMKVKSESEVTQLCPTLNDPMDCSPPGSSIHGSFQERVLEGGAIAFSEVWTYQCCLWHGSIGWLPLPQNCMKISFSKWPFLDMVGAFLVAQLVQNPSAMQETLIWILGWEDPLEKG